MRKGSHHTADSIAKMGGHDVSPEARAKISAASRNRSPETRAKLRANATGNKHRRGSDYRANHHYCARVYESSWGQIPREDSGRAYHIHHRDGNRQNDDPENLIALTTSEHAKLGSALRRGDWDLAAEIDAIGASRRQR